jgi:hypothetical protein
MAGARTKAADDHSVAQVDAAPQHAKLLGNLKGKFPSVHAVCVERPLCLWGVGLAHGTGPRGREHECKDAVGVRGQRLQDGQRECGRLATASLCAPDHVAPWSPIPRPRRRQSQARCHRDRERERKREMETCTHTRTLQGRRDTLPLDGRGRAEADRRTRLAQPPPNTQACERRRRRHLRGHVGHVVRKKHGRERRCGRWSSRRGCDRAGGGGGGGAGGWGPAAGAPRGRPATKGAGHAHRAVRCAWTDCTQRGAAFTHDCRRTTSRQLQAYGHYSLAAVAAQVLEVSPRVEPSHRLALLAHAGLHPSANAVAVGPTS